MTNWIVGILKAYRRETGESQADTASRLGISRTYLSRIERDEVGNLSYSLVVRILNLGKPHGQVEVTLPRRVSVDAPIAAEIVYLNHNNVVTEGSCQGPPPTALIRPSSVERARALGYEPELKEDIGLFEIRLKSE